MEEDEPVAGAVVVRREEEAVGVVGIVIVVEREVVDVICVIEELLVVKNDALDVVGDDIVELRTVGDIEDVDVRTEELVVVVRIELLEVPRTEDANVVEVLLAKTMYI